MYSDSIPGILVERLKLMLQPSLVDFSKSVVRKLTVGTFLKITFYVGNRYDDFSCPYVLLLSTSAVF